MKFPRKAWMPYCKTPQAILLQFLCFRKYNQLIKKLTPKKARYATDEYYWDCVNKYDLKDETERASLTPEEWKAFQDMNEQEKKRYEQELGKKLK
jgi:hypothetical protein